MMSRAKLAISVLLVVCLFFVGVPCRAQSREEIEVPSIAYSDDEAHEFYVGDEAEIGVSDQELERIGGVRGLHVRLFMGTRSELLTLYRYLKDGCLVYRNQTVPVRRTSKGLMLQRADGVPIVFNEQWLSRKPTSLGAEQWYLLVMERGGLIQPLTDNFKDELKIDIYDAREYFGRGFQIVVRPRRDPDASETAMLTSLNHRERTETADWFKSVHRGDCYKFRNLTLTGGGWLTPCDCGEESASNAAARQFDASHFLAPKTVESFVLRRSASGL
jgi:hypothetical protein